MHWHGRMPCCGVRGELLGLVEKEDEKGIYVIGI